MLERAHVPQERARARVPEREHAPPVPVLAQVPERAHVPQERARARVPERAHAPQKPAQ